MLLWKAILFYKDKWQKRVKCLQPAILAPNDRYSTVLKIACIDWGFNEMPSTCEVN